MEVGDKFFRREICASPNAICISMAYLLMASSFFQYLTASLWNLYLNTQ